VVEVFVPFVLVEACSKRGLDVRWLWSRCRSAYELSISGTVIVFAAMCREGFYHTHWWNDEEKSVVLFPTVGNVYAILICESVAAMIEICPGVIMLKVTDVLLELFVGH
jgi:hypothetical protein